MKGVQGWLVFAVAVIAIMAIVYRVTFVRNLVLGTTSTA